MSIPRSLIRGSAAVAVALLALLTAVSPAAAEEVTRTDARGDVPYARGDLIRMTATTIGDSALALRVRVARNGHPVDTWPNTNVRVRWLLDTDPTLNGPEYWADIVIQTGADTVLRGIVRNAETNAVECTADENVPGSNVVSSSLNEHRFRFVRGCIGVPDEVRVRASMRWDRGQPGGPTVTDFAPNAGRVGPISFV
jgi:hypothetical protein